MKNSYTFSLELLYKCVYYIHTYTHRIEIEMSLDQFYTKSEISKECLRLLTQHINFINFDVLLEPSAGRGAFYLLLDKEKRQGIDLEPKCAGVREQDFFDYKPTQSKSYLVVGNPPFGRGCSLAVKFFNKAATFANVIAFIIPRTFKRVSIQNRLDLSFNLVETKDLPTKPCCFEPVMAAKCCFQIWRRGEARKRVVFQKTHPHFTFLKLGPKDNKDQPTPPKGADFTLKAYGGKCGHIQTTDLHDLRPKSWHWIKSNIDKHILMARLLKLNYSISKDTVRQNSIGRYELIKLYNDFITK